MVQPGWICSRVWRHRESFSTMESTVAVQTKGLGFWFQTLRKSSMAAIRCSTLGNESRRMRLPISGELFHDGVHRGGPDEGLGILVPDVEEVFDGGDQMLDAGKRIPADAFAEIGRSFPQWSPPWRSRRRAWDSGSRR